MRSGAFHPFWALVTALGAEGRAPTLVVVENVRGTVTSHQGRDFATLCEAFARDGYRVGPLIVDAALFVPQSRPRLFLIGVRDDVPIPAALTRPSPVSPFHPPALARAVASLPASVRRRVVWWRAPTPAPRRTILADLLERPDPGDWHGRRETDRLMSLMSPVQRARIDAARWGDGARIGTLYRRTRGAGALKRQTAEARFDGVAGCLRTPGGGSSRQTLVVVEDGEVRSRLLTARETARLMGLPDSYRLPAGYTEACHLTGDGVVTKVVRHLAEHLFEPLIAAERNRPLAPARRSAVPA